MTSRRTNSNTSATANYNPGYAYSPPPTYEYYFTSPPPPSLSSPLNQLSPFDDFFSTDDADDVNDQWHFEYPDRPLSNTIQVTRVTRTRRPYEGAREAAQLPGFAGSLAPLGSRVHAVLLNDPRTRQILSNQWTPAAPRQEADSKLTHNEQKRALQKLRKEIYNPLRRISPTVNLYYRGTIVQDIDKERNDNGKSCAICLEDFEPKQEVMLTPCNHMFHEECIVPWVKSNGRCPVCRFGISD
ncbi:uncharacterized protein LOC126798954 [Argentina anserina]|uniref:uncharacterized protein LOC126798954 n=1 Tax=Argentina anserina TaxID=57926 RepID=UPI002176343E|nr:uncharacterized protein LOC126798954 [Potentilla anserina]